MKKSKHDKRNFKRGLAVTLEAIKSYNTRTIVLKFVKLTFLWEKNQIINNFLH